MGLRRFSLAVVVGLVAATTVLVAPTIAGADGITTVPATCSGIPVVGSLDSNVDVNLTDDVDPVVSGNQVKLTLKVPIPVEDIPVEGTVTEVKITTPIPAGVSIANVSFTSSSFSGQSWTVSGSNVVVTLTGSVKIGGSNPTPTVPDVTITANVTGAPRVIEWKVPTVITAKGSAVVIFPISFTATCTPKNTSTVLATTTVVAPNSAPVANGQSVSVAFETAKPIVLSGTDPDGDVLAYSIVGSPSHGALTGTPPNVTYTPASGYSGPDSFTFSVSDGSLSSTGTVSITVAPELATVPSAPVIEGVDVLGAGAATVGWAPPASDGGTAVTGYRVSVTQGDVTTVLGTTDAAGRSMSAYDLVDGVAATFSVVTTNAVGDGPAATGSATTQWWLPWSSGTVAVNELFTWMTGTAPTSSQRTSWLSQLNAGTKKVPDLIASLRGGADATSNVDPTARLYSAYLTRVPDASGLNFWIKRRRNGWKLAQISSNFAASNEFVRRYGNMTNRQFVQNIYANVLERAGDTSGITFWTSRLDRKVASRGQVMINFSESNEYKRKQTANVDAAAVYIHVLGKAPSLAQRSDFIASVATVGFEATVRELLRTPSFGSRAG